MSFTQNLIDHGMMIKVHKTISGAIRQAIAAVKAIEAQESQRPENGFIIVQCSRLTEISEKLCLVIILG